jgi:hypothetical protein
MHDKAPHINRFQDAESRGIDELIGIQASRQRHILVANVVCGNARSQRTGAIV